MSTTAIDPVMAARLDRLMRAAEEREKHIAEFMKAQPQEKPCPKHPQTLRRLTLERTQEATALNYGALTPGYERCPVCLSEREAEAIRQRLKSFGVPDILTASTFDNWHPQTPEQAEHLEAVKAFARIQRGFLIMIGNIGTGKSHLAVAVIRGARDAVFIKQNTLLRELRESYNDRKALNPIPRCQDASVLVLDEMGLSAGGRDELPMLHEILDHRHGERKPTILTGNCTWPELSNTLGTRLVDRLKESALRVVNFAGPSHRKEARDRYFAGQD